MAVRKKKISVLPSRREHIIRKKDQVQITIEEKKELQIESKKSGVVATKRVNNVYVQQQLDQLIPINDLPTLIANNPHLSSTLKTLTDINDFPKVSAIRDKWFANSKPASTLLEVNAMTRKETKIEIEVTAIIKK